MGREIRRVPPNWRHPTNSECKHIGGHGGKPCYKPLYAESYADVAQEWIENCIKWDNGTHEELKRNPSLKLEYPYYWLRRGSPPGSDYYVQYPDGVEFSWWQVYETVSEGTPVTPAFATDAELVDWLVNHGENAGTRYEKRFTRAQAEAFVQSGWAPSMMVMSNATSTTVSQGIEIPATMGWKNGDS